MADELIPEEVRQFIIDKIDSVAELEGLLLLRNQAEIEWDSATLARRLYINPQQTQEILAHLHAQGFLAVKENNLISYIYQPNSPELAEMVNRVAEIYAKYLIPVTNLIHNKPQSRVQKFADAFKFIRREDK
ncbi:hypothetical protein [Nitrosomonas sp. Nm34]|uniref:hypothetical protein n=1 Tax=Nitrosomonas sp. Nm34 TaxID=1881055 RepID=UPI0008E2446E|nr:hypothetical protein [Nitrosomonas sp. Nm34]SFI30530.1 hypothetical protein SAMN05428978_100514 [Nitrosomonas sp. Nm34]